MTAPFPFKPASIAIDALTLRASGGRFLTAAEAERFNQIDTLTKRLRDLRKQFKDAPASLAANISERISEVQKKLAALDAVEVLEGA